MLSPISACDIKLRKYGAKFWDNLGVNFPNASPNSPDNNVMAVLIVALPKFVPISDTVIFFPSIASLATPPKNSLPNVIAAATGTFPVPKSSAHHRIPHLSEYTLSRLFPVYSKRKVVHQSLYI